MLVVANKQRSGWLEGGAWRLRSGGGPSVLLVKLVFQLFAEGAARHSTLPPLSLSLPLSFVLTGPYIHIYTHIHDTHNICTAFIQLQFGSCSCVQNMHVPSCMLCLAVLVRGWRNCAWVECGWWGLSPSCWSSWRLDGCFAVWACSACSPNSRQCRLLMFFTWERTALRLRIMTSFK